VHPATAEDGETILGDLWPEARAVADPGGGLYRGFGLAEGSLAQLAGPRAALAFFRALFRGNRVGKPRGDVRLLPGTLLVRDGSVVRRHDARHAGDHPDFRRFVRPAS
jgi:hypothetical protein